MSAKIAQGLSTHIRSPFQGDFSPLTPSFGAGSLVPCSLTGDTDSSSSSVPLVDLVSSGPIDEVSAYKEVSLCTFLTSSVSRDFDLVFKSGRVKVFFYFTASVAFTTISVFFRSVTEGAPME